MDTGLCGLISLHVKDLAVKMQEQCPDKGHAPTQLPVEQDYLAQKMTLVMKLLSAQNVLMEDGPNGVIGQIVQRLVTDVQVQFITKPGHAPILLQWEEDLNVKEKNPRPKLVEMTFALCMLWPHTNLVEFNMMC